MTVLISYPAHDTGAMLRALLDVGYQVAFTQGAGVLDCVAELTGPLGSSATGQGLTPAAALASVWPLHDDLATPAPLDDDPDEEPGPVDATAAAILAAKITALRGFAGRVAAGGDQDQGAALGHVSAELGRISVILAAATEGTDDEDDQEPYCSACGHWAGVFHGIDG